MAEDLTPPRPGPPEPRPYRGRFLIAFAVLSCVLVAVAVGVTLLAMREGPKPAAAWSSWQPTDDGERGAQQIAERVSKAYRLDDGNQLVAARVGLPALADAPVVVAVSKVVAGKDDRDVQFVEGRPVVYLLCGLGERCAIRGGKPSTGRATLLRREGLELALYTFRYLDDVGSVVVFLPPKPGEQAQAAMMFQRKDVAKLLERPVGASLPGPKQIRPDALSKQEQSRLLSLTTRNVYEYSFQQAQDGSVVIVLDEPPIA